MSAAARAGDAELVQAFLTRGDDVNAADSVGMTPLLWACMKGHATVVELLLAHANTCCTGMDAAGRTALSHASGGGHADIVQILLSHGVGDINARMALVRARPAARRKRAPPSDSALPIASIAI